MRIGCAQDFATILLGVLSQFAALYPRMQIELEGAKSEVHIMMQKSEARLTETFADVQGVIQQELFYKEAAGLEYIMTDNGIVKKGDTVVLLEAMKMELPIRAPADATVRAVNCREGALVQP